MSGEIMSKNDSSTYISTRGKSGYLRFRDAVMTGLAPDGGLLLPQSIPDVTAELNKWRKLTYPELALEVMRRYVGSDIPVTDLRKLLNRAYSRFTAAEIVPVVQVGDLHIAELFHGPTLAFKDLALQFLGELFEYILAEEDRCLNLVGATSGDTGSAAIYGVRGKQNIKIFIMYPDGRVSPVQERQMTSVLDENVHNLAINGNFDDTQRILKALFQDLDFKEQYALGAVNSVNWARILAQIVYYFYATFRVQADTGAEKVQVCVPTGNFGNIFAGYLARRMGAPIERLVLAANRNDILARFFRTGRYERQGVAPTYSPSMDIEVASNFERYLYYREGRDSAKVEALMAAFARTGSLDLPNAAEDEVIAAGSCDQDRTLQTIRRYFETYSYLPDPHTAVGLEVGERFALEDTPTLCMATAHPAKFSDAVGKALGPEHVPSHPQLKALEEMPTRREVLAAETEAVQDYIRRHALTRNSITHS